MRAGIPATAITTLSLLLAIGSAVAVSVGHFALGGWLFIFVGICDFLDGRVARSSNRASAQGAALDSVLDRYCDGVVLVGLAVYYRNSWVLLPVLAALLGSLLVPYVRARGEGLGVNMRVGIMQRPERILCLGAATALSPIVALWVEPNAARPFYDFAVAGIIVLAVSTHTTALRRLLHLLAALRPTGLAARAGAYTARVMRHALSSGLATIADVILVYVLVTQTSVSAPLATALGCALGFAANLTINRVWMFGNSEPPAPQLGQYAVVSLTSTLLNMGGVALLMLIPGLGFWPAWVIARSGIAITWNYPLHREYVFRDWEEPKPSEAPSPRSVDRAA
jgi:phosphatidylglycerophosphate synthase/putative flippase GtrA